MADVIYDISLQEEHISMSLLPCQNEETMLDFHFAHIFVLMHLWNL